MFKITIGRIRYFVLVLLLFMFAALSACASGPQLVDHAFSFDVLAESPDVTLLNYRYGTSKHPGAHPPDWALREGRLIAQQSSVNGAMVLGDILYVKWRIKATGEVLEDTVDLKSSLHRDIANQRIHFVIKGRQLFVYLVSSDRRPSDFPIIGPKKFQFNKVYQVYPTSNLAE